MRPHPTPLERVAGSGPIYVGPEAPGARVWFFTRNGGVSAPPFDSLNVSTKVGDEKDLVGRNLDRIQAAMGGRLSAWVRQVAGDGVERVTAPGFAGEADALITDREGFSLVVAVADCAPIAFAGEGRVGMAHAGWRGTIAGIAGKTAREMGPSGLTAYLGPCIRECCYEVSGEIAGRFAQRFGSGVVSGRQLSLPAALRVDLEEAGVEEFDDLGLCTGCRPDLFYSHRMQGPRTGRSLAAVALEKAA